jgi:hypothetical protein
MLLIDADRSGIAGKLDELLRRMPELEPSVRINVALRMGKTHHPRFADAVDVVLRDVLPDRILAEGGGGMIASYGDVAGELIGGLGEAILAHAPDRMERYAMLLPPNIELLSQLGMKAIQAGASAMGLKLYERLFDLPMPEDGAERTSYLHALNNACVQAHAIKKYDVAVTFANRAQPVAHENPHIYHSAACAYAAVGDHARAFEQVKLAIEHDYDHIAKIEVDADLGPILEWPEFKALFRDWHARQGNK